jgi:hypothetical protein
MVLPESAAALSALGREANALASQSISAAERFAKLEQLRPSAIAQAAELRNAYLCKPLPLAADEYKVWQEHVAMWQAFYLGYALCADAGGETQDVALVWQRGLDSLARAIAEHVYAYRAIPPTLWGELNRCYSSAEACGLDEVTTRASDDSPASLTTCRAIYLCVVMLDAANLYSMPSDHVEVVMRWLPGFLTEVQMLAHPPQAANRSPLFVDLAAETGARIARNRAESETIRYLETGLLSSKLRDLAAAVRSGSMPAELAGSEALSRPALERLLTHLYVQWCSSGTGRTDERRESIARAQAAVTMHAVHFQVSGRAFRQPGLRYTREEEHDLATFGHITERTEHRLLTSRSSALETWEVINQSASGALGLIRRPGLDTRISHGQIIALRTTSSAPPVVAIVQRLKMEQDGTVHIGVRVVPGEARGVAVRLTGDPSQKYQRALLVGEDTERGTPPTLILPPGLVIPNAALEVFSNRAETVTITEIVGRGPTHEQAGFRRPAK